MFLDSLFMLRHALVCAAVDRLPVNRTSFRFNAGREPVALMS